MADIEISLDGIDDLEKKLGRVDILDLLRDPMTRAILRLQSRMATYPPQRTGSKYRRTGNYGKLWTHRIERDSESIRGFLGNRILYGPFVGSEQFQAHQNRQWTTDRQALEAERNGIINDFQVTISNALGDL